MGQYRNVLGKTEEYYDILNIYQPFVLSKYFNIFEIFELEWTTVLLCSCLEDY